MKRVLITNDDGIHAEGLKALEAGLAGVGEVFVVAPEREMSATGQAISIHLPLRVRALDERHYAVSGTAADAVILAIPQLLAAKPHLVLPGINPAASGPPRLPLPQSPIPLAAISSGNRRQVTRPTNYSIKGRSLKAGANRR